MASVPAPAEIDKIVSGMAWSRFPALRDGVEKWIEVAGENSDGLLISAVGIGIDWISVRVSMVNGDGTESDWTEWVAETSYREAKPEAVHHFVATKMERAYESLALRVAIGGPPRTLAKPITTQHAEEEAPKDMAKKPEPAKATTPTKKTEPAKASKPAPAPKAPASKAPASKAPAPAATSKPGPKPKAKPATKTAVPQAPPATSKPGPKPKAKPGRKPATASA